MESNKCKTAELIGLKFHVGAHITSRKVYGCLKLQKFISKLFNFCKILKIHKKCYLIRKLFLLFFILYIEKMFTNRATIKSWKRRWTRSSMLKAILENKNTWSWPLSISKEWFKPSPFRILFVLVLSTENICNIACHFLGTPLRGLHVIIVRTGFCSPVRITIYY